MKTKQYRLSVIHRHRGKSIFWLACALAAMEIAPASGQVSELVLHNFNVGPGGYDPQAGVTLAADGLYGTNHSSSTGGGVVYKLDATGHYTVLYSFTGGTDGSGPVAGVIRDTAGNLYGTAVYGGTGNLGVVYKLDATGHYTVLYNFTGGTDGGKPFAGVIQDSAGNLYGTTLGGGTAGFGVVYKLDAAGQETVLYSFTGGADGRYPSAGVIRDSAGNLYGTTSGGGVPLGGSCREYNGCGVVYKLDSTGHETVLYRFTGGADGAVPNGVIGDSAGDLYGSALYGTAVGGVVFKLDANRNYTVLHSFTGPDGCSPNSVIRDAASNLYGTTQSCGTAGAGVVYTLDAAGQYTVLYSFTGGADGGYSLGGLVRGPAGNLFGTTAGYGKYFQGVIFVLKGVQ